MREPQQGLIEKNLTKDMGRGKRDKREVEDIQRLATKEGISSQGIASRSERKDTAEVWLGLGAWLWLMGVVMARGRGYDAGGVALTTRGGLSFG